MYACSLNDAYWEKLAEPENFVMFLSFIAYFTDLYLHVSIFLEVLGRLF